MDKDALNVDTMPSEIVINGRVYRLEDTAAEAESKHSPFDRVRHGGTYFIIDNRFQVTKDTELDTELDANAHECGNYCANEALMQERAAQIRLTQLLWRYSMEHGGENIDWNDTNQQKFTIFHNGADAIWDVETYCWTNYIGAVYFATKETAQAAIRDIVRPFYGVAVDDEGQYL